MDMKAIFITIMIFIVIIIITSPIYIWMFIKYKKVYAILEKGFREKETFGPNDFYDYIEENGDSIRYFGYLKAKGVLYLVLRKLYKERKIVPVTKPDTGYWFFTHEEYKFFIDNTWQSRNY